MKKIRVGIFGFGSAGKLVVNEFLKDDRFTVCWVVRHSDTQRGQFAGILLGHEREEGRLYSNEDVGSSFFYEHPVDVIIDFSYEKGVYLYEAGAKAGIPVVTAISNYEEAELRQLEMYAQTAPVLYSPNITIGINVLMIAAQTLQKIVPHADIEIVEEHFSTKKEVSGTAKRIAKALNVDEMERINSVRVGGIVGHHEIIFGLPNQTIRLVHDSLSRAAFGQGAIFAALHIVDNKPGMYTMEAIIAEKFKSNIPVY